MLHSRREAAVGLLATAATALLPSSVRADTQTPANVITPAQAPLPQTASPQTASPQAPSGQPPPVEGSVTAGRDPFDHLTAPVMLNGQGPFPFVVDTGASISCVSQKLAEELGLPIQEERVVHTMVGTRRVPMAMIDELRVGVRRERRVAALMIPLVEREVHGVLAVDWLKGQRVTLDFAAKSLVFTHSKAEHSEPGRVVVPARRRHGQLTIVDADLGQQRVNAMIDSGSEASLCNSALLNLLDRKQATPPERRLVQMISIVGEPFAGELVYLPFLQLGGLQLGNVGVVHSDTHAFAIWGFADKPAVLLGMDLLRQFRAVSLDFGRDQVRFDLTASQL
jgi:predicted aspartyl protease